MSWQTEYHFNFISLDGKNNLVEFLIDSATTVTDTEITGAANPFIVELPSLDSIFQVVRGTGTTIQLLSETDMQFFDSLYTSDPFGIMVRHSIDGVLNWLGYINSEMMQEPYSFSSNYPIQILANNGLSLLTRLSFLQSDQSYYTGIKSKYELLKICLDKIGLPWMTINIACTTTFSGQTSNSDSTILHESYLNCSNFYTEDPAPMTLREVIETILEPYGAFIWADADGIYISDVNGFAAGTSITYKQFDYSTDAYVQDVVISNNQAVSSIGYMGTGQNIENSGGVNKQVVDYSPYSQTEIVAQSVKDESEFTTIPASYSSKDGYYYRTLTGNSLWQEISPATFEESYFTNNPQIYLQWTPPATNQKILSLKLPPFVCIAKGTDLLHPLKGVAFQVSFSLLIKTKTNPYDSSLSSVNFQGAAPIIKVKVGNQYYDLNLSKWSTTDNYLNPIVSNSGNSISDTFTSWKMWPYIRMSTVLTGEQEILYGDFDLELWSDIWGYTDILAGTYTVNPSQILEVWINNIEVKVTLGDGTEISNTDKEYIGLLDPNFQNEGKKVTLKSGTNLYNVDNAKEMYIDTLSAFPSNDYTWIGLWTRAGQTDKIENLLLNSYVSNFKAGTNKITNLALENNASIWQAITDSYRSGRIFMVKRAKIDYWDNKIECDIAEVKQDELTITSI